MVDAVDAPLHALRAMAKDAGEPAVIVRSFPSSDHDFARATHEALDASSTTDPHALLEVVDRRLRKEYPNSRIIPQDDMANLGKGPMVWYVYRDGRVRRTDERRDHMYHAVAEARRTMRSAEATMDRSREVAHRAGFDANPPAVDPPISSLGPAKTGRREGSRPRSAPRRQGEG